MRVHDWQSKLAALLKAKQKEPREWGRNDCCLFACDAIQAVTGLDPAESFRGTYDSALGGYRRIHEFCGGGVEQLAEKQAELFGFVEIAPAMAQRGDVGLYRDPESGATLGVCMGSRFAFVGESGFRYLGFEEVARAWRIG